MPEILRRMQERLIEEATADEGEFWTTTGLLLRLRVPEAEALDLLKGVRRMKESSVYQEIVREGLIEGRIEGRMEEARSLILRLGTRRFGTPSSTVRATIETISSMERLEQLAERLLEVESWAELLEAA